MKTKLLPLLLLTVAANAFALDTPTEDFIDNNDGTVTHKKTGLTWQRCSVGQTWSGGTCTGTAQTMDWNAAMAKASGEWRVPRIDELDSIVEWNNVQPAINSGVFPNTVPNYFWSSSKFSNLFWIVDFSIGKSAKATNDNLFVVRLVKGGKTLPATGEFTPIDDFTDNGNGTVTHKTTNLMWQRCAVGQEWSGTTCLNTGIKSTYSIVKTNISSFAGFNDWRLPTASELKSIAEYLYSGTLNPNVFPNPSAGWYWTSTPAVFTSGVSTDSVKAISFNFPSNDTFYSGNDANAFISGNFSDPLLVRLVRSTNSTPALAIPTTVDLSSTITSSTNRIAQNNNLTYTATAQNNGTGTANNVFLKFYMPPRWTNYVSLPSDCAFNGTTTVCNVGSLAAGSSVSRSITVSFSKFRGATSVGAFAGSDETDTNKSNNMSRMITTVTK